MALHVDAFIEKYGFLFDLISRAKMKADLEEMMHEMGAASVQKYVMDQAALSQQAGFHLRDRLKDRI